MILSAVLPSHFSGTPPFFQSPANSRSKNGGIASGSVPTSSLVPMVIVSGLSVLSRSVMQGIPITVVRSEEHTSELQSRGHLVCRLLLAKEKDWYRRVVGAG